MTTYCILDANGNVLTTFANSQQPTSQQGYTEIPVSGGQVGQVWNGTVFVAGTPSAGTLFDAAIAAGLTVTSTGTPALNGTYSCTKDSQDEISATAASIGAGQGLPGGNSTMQYFDTSNTAHTVTSAQFLSIADVIRNYVYELNVALNTAIAGGTPTWPQATATIP